MFKLEMKAGEMAALISKMTALSGGASLFSPLLVNVDTKNKRMKWAWITADNTAYTWGKASKLKLKGDSGEYVVDAEIVSWINNLFGDEEKVVLEHRESTVYLKGDKYEAQFSPTDADATRVEQASQMKIKNNLPVIGDIKFHEVQIKISELNAIVSPTTLVYGQKEIKVVRLTFDEKGSIATIGSLEAHETGIARPIEAKVTKGFEVILGINFAEVIGVLSGEVKIFGAAGNKPLWILNEEDNLMVGYLIAPYDESQEPEEEDEPEEDGKEKKEDDDEDIDLGDD